ncbi:MAG: alpha/beta fold hydrolase [Promethearchaeota archaeon]|nr:MAG: alpha/beta fold hydrolase [Candidatus Lokiarchaeota archaeon]
MKVKNPPNVLPGAEGFLIEGSDYGVMLIHGGGGGSAADMREIGAFINEYTGFTVFAPLLPGFGTVKEDLVDVTVADWINAVKAGFQEFQRDLKKTFVLGHSMGGVLALYLASEYIDQIAGVISISAPMKLKGLLIKFVPFFRHFLKFYKQNDLEEWARVTNGIWVGYEYIPLSIVGKFKNLIKMTYGQLNQITSPILIIQGTRDEFVTKQSPARIYEKVGSSRKTLLWFNSDHAILFAQIKTDMFKAVVDFLKQLGET